MSPKEIIDHFIEAADKFGGSRPLDDDMTFVVLKIFHCDKNLLNIIL